MRALLVVPRLPGTGFTGDRVRAEVLIEALRLAGFDVTLVGGAPRKVPSGMVVHGVSEIHGVAASLPSRGLGLVRALLKGDPLQSALVAGDWDRALSGAGSRFDLIVWSLVRLWPHVRGRLPWGPVVVDYVDALSCAARQAARLDPARWRRLYWAFEAPRLARAERHAAESSVARLATTPFDAGELPSGTESHPHGVRLGPRPGETPRERIVVFSGRLLYRPNQLAVRRLTRDIWPRVRASIPEARLVLAGADAPAEFSRLHGTNGISVVSPVGDMPALLRTARVMAAPVDLGTGTPNKLFEAFEAGTPVVSSEAVLSRSEVNGIRPPARAARTDQEFASALVSYLMDPGLAVKDGLLGRTFVEDHADRLSAVSRLAERFRAASLGGR